MRSFLIAITLLLSACASEQTRPTAPPAATQVQQSIPCSCIPDENFAPIQIPDADTYSPAPTTPIKPGDIPKGADLRLIKTANWSDLAGFDQDHAAEAWDAFMLSCSTIKTQELWKPICDAAALLNKPSDEAVRNFLRTNLTPYQVINPDNTDTGLVTGYYEPLLKGSRIKTAKYRYPLYSKPDDLITVDLGSIYPELAHRRLRGKLVGNKIVPYYSRGEIELTNSPLAGREFLYVEDIVELFFLQIQGSGMVQLESGEQIHVGYDDQNGQPYQSIGRILIERGELTADKASMQGIKEWGRRNLDKLRALLNENTSYVFFRELPKGLTGPLGALGVPLTTQRSIAVDPRYIPLGTPVFLSTTQPNSKNPLRRIMLAQDTGGAIKGAVRADFFWGASADAAKQAGSMKQRESKIWLLLPKNYKATQ